VPPAHRASETAHGAARSRRTRPTAAAFEPQPGGYELTFGTAELLRDLDTANGWLLLVNGVPSSYVDLDDPLHLEFEYVRWTADVLDVIAAPPAPLEMVHIGGAGCTLPRYVAATRPGSRQLVFERDARLVDLARSQLQLRTSPQLRLKAVDGRQALRRRRSDSADVVIRDAFSGPVVPAELAAVEFIRDVRRVLRAGGAYVVNTADRTPLTWLRAEAATLLAVFSHVALVTEPAVLRGRRYGNAVLVGTAGQLPLDALARRLSTGPAPARVLSTARVRQLVRDAAVITDVAVPPAPALPGNTDWSTTGPFPRGGQSSDNAPG
jgi:spermidine synthase